MLNVERVWIVLAGFLPICATVATLAPIAGLAHLGIGVVVLGAAVCLSARRSSHHLLRIPLAAFGVAVLAVVFGHSLVAGDVLFVAIALGARLAARLGHRAAAVGRTVLLPLTALFIAPPVPLGQHRLAMAGWVVLACLVAAAWSAAIPALLPRPRANTRRVARAARAAAARPTARRVRALNAAALALDARLSTEDVPARRALCEVEHAVDRVRAGTGEAGEVEQALSRLGSPRTGPVPPPPPSTASPRTHTKLALQTAMALALAFTAGQLLFPMHWPWTVVTVITVSLGARSRGEVAVKTVQRLAGALAATAVLTPLAAHLAKHRAVTVLLVLAILGAGLYLRERSYIWWPTAITSILALLYGLLGEAGGASILRERLLAIVVGGGCAIVPAALLVPIRTRDVTRKRAAECLRAIRDCLAAPVDVTAVRRVDTAVTSLSTVARPLTLTRRIRPTAEAGWVDALAGCVPPLRSTLVAGTEAPQVRRVLAAVSEDLCGRVASRGSPTELRRATQAN